MDVTKFHLINLYLWHSFTICTIVTLNNKNEFYSLQQVNGINNHIIVSIDWDSIAKGCINSLFNP